MFMSLTGSSFRLLAGLLLLLPLPAAVLAQQAPLRVAAAADLATCMAKINAASGVEATSTLGASGSFYAQIRNGAPFDVFLSADTDYPRALADAGLAEAASLFVYAHGRLVLWSAAPGTKLDAGLNALTDPSIRRIAIANPDLAPYGKAARSALQRAGLWDQLQGKLVFGDNVAQTMQFIESGNAQAGLVSSAHLVGRSNGWALPAGSYPLIEQGAILTRRGAAHPQGAAYLRFLRSDRGRGVLAECGFLLPPVRE